MKMKTRPRRQTLPYMKKGAARPRLVWMSRKVLVMMNQQKLEVTLAMVWVMPLDLTGRISVATTQVRLPRPRLKATVKHMRRGSGSQE